MAAVPPVGGDVGAAGEGGSVVGEGVLGAGCFGVGAGAAVVVVVGANPVTRLQSWSLEGSAQLHMGAFRS